MLDQEDLSRKGAKAQRKPFRNAAALCAFAPLREKSSRRITLTLRSNCITTHNAKVFFPGT
jgi:hypothetical protein